MELWTIGHSTRSLDELVTLLKAHGVEQLIDVRHLPGSRRYPHFNKETLGPALRRRGVGYRHMLGLGGRRRPVKGSEANAGWRNAAFRGYADYMATPEFRRQLAALLELARRKRVAIMCAEAVPWRCHRSMIADALTARGVAVRHIMTPGSARLHRLNPMAVLRRGRLSYPVDVPSAPTGRPRRGSRSTAASEPPR